MSIKNNWTKEYPRPMLKRDSYYSLNGEWTLNNNQIIVPFPPQSKLSQYHNEVEENLHYHKTFTLPNHFYKDNERVILHFGAVDQICDVYLNNQLLGHNEGGYLPFHFDITDYLKDENELVVIATDTLTHDYPYGKQRKDRGGMWYTPVSGIWQSVWIESVSEDYIENLTITPDIDNNQVNIIIKSTSPIYTLKILDEGKVIFKEKQNNGIFKVNIKEVKLWSPENPFLYNIEISKKTYHLFHHAL